MSKIIYTKEVLEDAIKNSEFLIDVFKRLDARPGGNTYIRIKALIQEYGIDTSHFKNGRHKGFVNSKIGERKSSDEILVDGKKRREDSKLLRRALIESGVPYVCSCCEIGPEWNGKPLTIQVHHIDGVWSNCRKDNLQFLCPMCHSQTEDWCNQDTGRRCKNCNKKITSQSTWCKQCCGLFQNNERKADRPSLEILFREVDELGYTGTGKKYGVSDSAVRKWIKTETKRMNVVKFEAEW